MLGSDQDIGEVVRLAGGTSKGVYRVWLGGGATTGSAPTDGKPTGDRSAIVYVWSPTEDDWPARSSDADPSGALFAAVTDARPFAVAHETLTALGVRVPRVHAIDRSRRHVPGDAAVLEDVGVVTLETLLRTDHQAGGRALGYLADTLARMHDHLGPCPGRVAEVAEGSGHDADTAPPFERAVYERALADLDVAAVREPHVDAARERLGTTLADLFASTSTRNEPRLVHGELGPDHIAIDGEGRPCLLDIDGLMFADVEWEHAYLRLRFGPHYSALRRDDLDHDRLRFYTLALHLSLVAGPLLLLEGSDRHRDVMGAIVEHNLKQALAFTV